MTEQEMQNVENIIAIARENNIVCNTCMMGNRTCFFAYPCLSNNYLHYAPKESMKKLLTTMTKYDIIKILKGEETNV